MIKYVTSEEASKIIETRKPLGKFFEIDFEAEEIIYIGIDNTTGDAWVEEFEDIEECICWLNQEEYYGDINEKEICKQALDLYGKKAQICMVFEEMAELQKELCKYLRESEIIGNITEEIADVEIMLEQMKLLFDIEKEVEEEKKYKLKRLEERLKEKEIQRCRVCGCTYYTPCEGGCYWVEEDLCSKCAEIIREQEE